MKLQIAHVSKQYGKVWGVRDLSLDIGPGVLGLVGPNGAGKSTLMRILATITRPTDGAVTWNGTDLVRSPDGVRAVLGYLPQDFGVYPNLNAIEFLEYMAALKGLDRHAARRRIDELLQLLNLAEVCRRPLGGYSGGMKQRVGLAQALLNDPQLLIVDEPTAGLDPEERVRFRTILADLSERRIVILSTHIISDVEATATTVAIIRQGCLLAHLAPEALLQLAAGKVWKWVIPSTAMAEVRERFRVCSVLQRSEGVQVRLLADTAPAADAEPASPVLEDAYLYYISNHKEGRPR
jgi:ABC-2 type transport system ATP-binding protein